MVLPSVDVGRGLAVEGGEEEVCFLVRQRET